MKWINLLNFVLDMVKIENKGRTTTQNDVSKHQVDDILLLTFHSPFPRKTANIMHEKVNVEYIQHMMHRGNLV